jgi:peptide/nickel transport system permease protein
MWLGNILRDGNFGRSFQWNQPVWKVISDRLPITILISVLTLIFTYAVAIPIGIYSAVHKYGASDMILTFLGFIGLSVPPFLLALVLVFFAYSSLHIAVTGLFSPEFADAAFSFAKLGNMLKRIWIPVIIVGLSGTASIIRVMRGCLLDELKKQYVVTARSKGLAERRLLFKYPVRVAINPIVSTIGWLLPQIVSGAPLVAIVLNLPTVGPVLLRALLFQDMYLAGSIVLILSVLTLFGTLISDLLLAALDPRIRFGQGATR